MIYASSKEVIKSTLNLHEWTQLDKHFSTDWICLHVHEMLYIKQLRPPLNLQTDSIHAKVFV